MQRRRRVRSSPRAVSSTSAVVVGGLLLAGCGLVDTSEDTAKPPAASPASVVELDCAEQGQVAGAGSSAQQNAMTYWMREYQRACAGVQIAYNPLGSGAGVAQFLRGATAFGGSDSALKDDEVRLSENTCEGGRAVNLPMAGGPVAIGFNLPGVDKLVLDAPTLAKLFDGRIESWDDPRVKALNPDVDLPATPVHPVHRSDDSGTTQNFQSYLSETAGDSWPYPAEKIWQGRGGSSASGSNGVASSVSSTTGAIGYLDLSVAVERHVDTVSVDTGADRPVDPTPESASKGIAEARTVGRGKDLSLDFDYGTAAEGAYPIVLVTYEIVCDQGNEPATLPALKSFLAYTASEEGQGVLPRLHYAPLPKELSAEVRQVIRTLK